MKRERSIIILVAGMCILLYFAGVLSGLYANKITEKKTQTSLTNLKRETRADLETFKSGTEEQIENLNDYIVFLESNINTVQVEQEFLETLPPEERCAFSELRMQDMIGQLQHYRDQLPFRLEAYERETPLTDEYKILKQQYNALSIRTWIFARAHRAECATALVDGLYFYSASCEGCVEQGEELDAFTQAMEQTGQSVMLFTIDADADDSMIRFLRAYYDITRLPALVLNDVVYTGRIVPAETLIGGVA